MTISLKKLKILIINSYFTIQNIRKSIITMLTRGRKKNTQAYFNKWKICKLERDIMRIESSSYHKFNAWVVPCATDHAVCIKHGNEDFESIVIDNHILLSAYTYSSQFIELLRIFTDDTNTHLIVPIYYQELREKTKQDRTTREWLDCGISINGKCKEGEEYIDSMKREIAEEVGILVGKSVTNNLSKSKFDEKFGVFYAKDAIPYSSTHEIKFSSEKDYPRKKICSFIIGSFEECTQLVKKSRELYPSTEFNYGVAVIPIQCALNPTYVSKISR